MTVINVIIFFFAVYKADNKLAFIALSLLNGLNEGHRTCEIMRTRSLKEKKRAHVNLDNCHWNVCVTFSCARCNLATGDVCPSVRHMPVMHQ